MTRTADGNVRPLQPRELFRSQQFATAVYRSALAVRLRSVGYQVERGASGQPEIAGYSQDYLEASSPRRRQIEEQLAKTNQRGAAAAQIAAHKTRQAKVDLYPDAVQRAHQAMAAHYGYQPQHVLQAARLHGTREVVHEPTVTARQAVTFAKERNMERDAVIDERTLMRDALARSMGHRTIHEVRTEFEQRAGSKEFIQVAPQKPTPARQFTTAEMITLERENIAHMRRGQGTMGVLASPDIRRDVADHYQHLSPQQHAAVERLLANRDQVQGAGGRCRQWEDHRARRRA